MRNPFQNPLLQSGIGAVGTVAAAMTIIQYSGGHRNATIVLLALVASLFTFWAFHYQRLYQSAIEERNELRRQYEASLKSGLATYCQKEEQLQDSAVDLLSSSTRSLHYYGGTNLIGAAKGKWKVMLRDKLRDPDFTVERYIDLRSPRELLDLYRNDGVDTATEVKAYRDWLETQCEEMRVHPQMNSIFDYPGAPIWQWGVHLLIFDRAHILVAFNLDRGSRRGLVIRDQPEAASAMVDALHWVRNRLHVTTCTADVLSAMIDEAAEMIAEPARQRT